MNSLSTFKGTRKERGIILDESDDTETSKDYYNEGYEVYRPLLPARILRWKLMKYIPFLPYEQH
jgi:hypothetical protein